MDSTRISNTAFILFILITSIACSSGGGEGINVDLNSLTGNQQSKETNNSTSPSNLTTVIGDQQITINWDPVPAASSYNLYYSLTGNFESDGKKIENVTPGFTHAPLDNNQTYYYIIKAVIDGVESTTGTSSNPTSPDDSTKILSKPENLIASSGDGAINLNWDNVSGATSYNVYFQMNSGVSKSSTKLINSPNNQYTHSSLNNGATYYYIVTASDSNSESEASIEIQATPFSNSPPSTPSNFNAIAGNAQVTLNWDQVSDATEYHVYAATNTGVNKSAINIYSGSNTTFTHSSIFNGTTYYYVITSKNNSGESSISSEVNATPSSTPPLPSTPQNLTASSGNNQVTLSWDNVNNATQYNLYAATNSGVNKNSTKISTSSNTSFVHSALFNNTTYYYVVTAENINGESNISLESSATPTVPPPPPSAPQNLVATSGNNQINLSWDSSTGAETYNVYFSTSQGVDKNSNKLTTSSNTSALHNFLNNGTTYYYIVTSQNSGGESSISSEVNSTPFFKPTTKANIIILFSDDTGYADVGFQPNANKDIKNLTPNIDLIASEGVRFSDAYMSSSLCSPSRAGLLTGRYQQRFGHEKNLPALTPSGLPLSEKLISDRLAPHGYTSGCIGKWHLGYPDEYHPYNRNFYFYGLIQGSRPYFPVTDVTPEQVIRENQIFTPEQGYVTDRFGNAATNFITNNKDNPFFLFVAFTATHGPLQPKAEDLSHPEVQSISDTTRQNYAGLLVGLDRNIGKILNALKTNNIDEKTLLIFTNDNGGKLSLGATNTPLKGEKGNLAEGGIRVPMAMRWPGVIKPNTVITDPVISFDFLPTCISLAQGEVDPSWGLDGVDLLPLLAGDINTLPERTLYWRNGGPVTGTVAMRTGPWKYMHNRNTNTQPKLYRLDFDISESNNLSTDHPDIMSSFQTKLIDWENQLTSPLW